MKIKSKIRSIGTAGLILFMILAGCAANTHAEKMPSSPGARKAAVRQRPSLQKEMAAKGMDWGAPIFIRIYKAEKRMELWLKTKGRFKLFKSYPVCSYGGMGTGPKIREGDGRAPEGFYFVPPNQLNPYSSFHLAFNLGYPNAYDRRHSRTGSALMVHGSCISIGCFAMTDKAMEEIYTLAEAALGNGQSFFRVHIFPFKMTSENMRKHRHSPWLDFWRNIKTGHDWFAENNHLPPDVTVRKGRYCFNPANE